MGAMLIERVRNPPIGEVRFKIVKQDIPEWFALRYRGTHSYGWSWRAPNGVEVRSASTPAIDTNGYLIIFVWGRERSRDNDVLTCNQENYDRILRALTQLNEYISRTPEGQISLEEEFFGRIR